MEKTTSKSKKTASKDDASLLENFFVEELKDIYWAEKHLTKALPKMQKAATSEDLATAFADHLVATQEHISRLERVFEMLDKKPQAKKCDAMEGILKEGESIISETEAGSATRDVGLILAAQKAEHYEIATYGGLAQLAKTMGREDIKNLLGQTLDEEKECDELLTSLAEEDINETADQE
jgi:ferritin-like metal-binding protein YciE